MVRLILKEATITTTTTTATTATIHHLEVEKRILVVGTIRHG